MGRRRTIDRDDLLDAAERVVLRDGASRLTIEAVAKEAGVSKGGVLYAFSTKDALIDALFVRIFASFDEAHQQHLDVIGDTPGNQITAHVLASRGAVEPNLGRMAVLTANFMRSPEYRQHAIEYLRELLARLDVSTDRGRRARLALLACEGLFMLRGFEFWPVTEKEWRSVHDDIVSFLLEN